ncbi:hypothetical protein [Legionella sp. WA2022007384]
MKSKTASDAQKSSDKSKKWSFLGASKQVLDEEKNLKNSEIEAVKDKNESINNLDNIVEAEPDINQLLKYK